LTYEKIMLKWHLLLIYYKSVTYIYNILKIHCKYYEAL